MIICDNKLQHVASSICQNILVYFKSLALLEFGVLEGFAKIRWSDKKLQLKGIFYKVESNTLEVQLMAKTWITTKYKAYK
jgi:hypothetical protein